MFVLPQFFRLFGNPNATEAGAQSFYSLPQALRGPFQPGRVDSVFLDQKCFGNRPLANFLSLPTWEETTRTPAGTLYLRVIV